MIFTGKNTDFLAIWNCQKQSYTVYKNGRFMVTKYRFADIQSYLD